MEVLCDSLSRDIIRNRQRLGAPVKLYQLQRSKVVHDPVRVRLRHLRSSMASEQSYDRAARRLGRTDAHRAVLKHDTPGRVLRHCKLLHGQQVPSRVRLAVLDRLGGDAVRAGRQVQDLDSATEKLQRGGRDNGPWLARGSDAVEHLARAGDDGGVGAVVFGDALFDLRRVCMHVIVFFFS